jgi:hypothetical protein
MTLRASGLHVRIIPSLIKATQIYLPDTIQYYSINILASTKINTIILVLGLHSQIIL